MKIKYVKIIFLFTGLLIMSGCSFAGLPLQTLKAADTVVRTTGDVTVQTIKTAGEIGKAAIKTPAVNTLLLRKIP